MVGRTSLQLPLRLLNDSAHLLESLDDPQARERRVLELLNRVVPYDECVLLKAQDGERELVVVPETTKKNVAALELATVSCLAMITDPSFAGFSGKPAPPLAAVVPWRSYLGLPLIGNDKIIGLLFVGANEEVSYDETDLGLLSVIAGQLSAYMTSVWLHQQQMAKAEELRTSQAYARRLFDSNLIGILEAEGDNIVDANGAFLRIIGYERADLSGGLNWRAMTPPEYTHLDERALRELETAGEAVAYEKEYIRKDGVRVPILIGAAATQQAPLRWVCFVVDLTERRRVEEELERTRSEFLGEVSHELKTPLTAIKGSTSMALTSGTPPSDAEARELFTVIDEQAERLRELIGNLLDMTRIEAGSLSVNPQPERLSKVIEEAVSTFDRSAFGHPVKVVMPPSLPPVYADRRRVVQVVMNLLTNAAKASPPETPIAITAQPNDNQVIVQVRDQGRGIAADKLPLLFKKFTQVHESGGRGTGLGLVICKGIIEAHGGHIWADSPGEGEGATVSFTLPVASGDRT